MAARAQGYWASPCRGLDTSSSTTQHATATQVCADNIRSGKYDIGIAIGLDKHPRGAFTDDPAKLALPQWYAENGQFATTKFFGMKAPRQGAPLVIDQPSSYLAVSELVVRAIDGKMFTQDSVNWPQYTANLPQSAAVSENANAIVIQYQGKPYVQLNGGSWVPYPQ